MLICDPAFQHSITPSTSLSIFRYISKDREKYIFRSIVFTWDHWHGTPTVGGAGGFEERRIGERYKLALPVQLSDGIGTTCDISTSGIFFETESARSIGDTINFEHETLQCEARVVRVEPRNGQLGVAAELKSYVFC